MSCPHKSLLKKGSDYVCISCMSTVFSSVPNPKEWPVIPPPTPPYVTVLNISDSETGASENWVVAGDNENHTWFDEVIMGRVGSYECSAYCGEGDIYCSDCEEGKEGCGDYMDVTFRALAEGLSGAELRRMVRDQFDSVTAWVVVHHPKE